MRSSIYCMKWKYGHFLYQYLINKPEVFEIGGVYMDTQNFFDGLKHQC